MHVDELHTSFTFDDTARSGGAHAVAASLAQHAGIAAGVGGLVIVTDPDDDRRQVVAGGIDSPLRAAVSATVAAGHSHLWSTAPILATCELDLRMCPDVLRAAIDGASVRAVHIGAVRRDDRVACVAMWFDQGVGVAPEHDRHNSLRLLEGAVDRDIVRAREQAAQDAIRLAQVAPAAPAEDPVDDGSLDTLTGVSTRETFIDFLEDYEGDEAVLVLLDLDDFDAVRAGYGADAADAVLRTVADRLNASTRRTDLVARVDDHRFGILFADADRNAAMVIVQRLQGAIGEPIDAAGEPVVTTATVAFAHQDGLIDLEEMVESAEAAIASGRRSGPGRLVLAS